MRDTILPSIENLFSLPDAAMRIMCVAAGLHKLNVNDHLHHVNMKGIEDFKSINILDNHRIEEYLVRMSQQRMHCVKIGNCDEQLENVSTKFKSEHKKVRVLKILNRHIVSLKLINMVLM